MTIRNLTGRLRMSRACVLLALLVAIFVAATDTLRADSNPHVMPISLGADDVIPTGNEWISLPTIRASDGSLGQLNALSMRARGLLEVTGVGGGPAITPYFTVDEKPLTLPKLSWELIEYWIPVAHATADGLEMSMVYCAPPGSRAAFLKLSVTNRRAIAVDTTVGLSAIFGALNRVTYLPEALRGERTVSTGAWVSHSATFSYGTDDTQFSWSVVYPGSEAELTAPPVSPAPSVRAAKKMRLSPGETSEALFIFGIGIEEFSATHNAEALHQLLERDGADQVIAHAAQWCRERTRSTGQPDLDLLMNRNYLFTELYAWGRTIDTEQWVGVTSRSPRYYVSAAYWDRDAMLWSFPALLDVDPAMAAHALHYALTTQLNNTGTHSRFIDGVVLEDGLQLDELVAPVIALGSYMRKTQDTAFLQAHRDAVLTLRDRIRADRDAQSGLYLSLQDSQDEFQTLKFLTYDNVLTWRALKDMSELLDRLNEPQGANEARDEAAALRTAILAHCTSAEAPGATGPMFVSATDGKRSIFTEIPPGSLMKLPLLGFVPEDNPIFKRTYDWLHSTNYSYSYAQQPYGLPGSYRLPFTTSWSVADHLLLRRGHDQALKILRASAWDGGILTEGVDPSTARMDQAGRAFATAAGYMAHAICEAACSSKP